MAVGSNPTTLTCILNDIVMHQIYFEISSSLAVKRLAVNQKIIGSNPI